MPGKPIPQLTTASGVAVTWDGPTAAAVRKALDAAKLTRSKKVPGKALPSVGYVVVKPRDVAYVEVSTTAMEKASRLARYADVLRKAGFVVEDDRFHSGSKIIVFQTDPRFAAPAE